MNLRNLRFRIVLFILIIISLSIGNLVFISSQFARLD